MPKGFVIDGPGAGATVETKAGGFDVPVDAANADWVGPDEPRPHVPYNLLTYHWSPLCGGIWYCSEASLALIEELTPEIVKETFRGPKATLPGRYFGIPFFRSHHWKRRGKQWPRDGFTLQYGLHNRSFTLMHWQRSDLRARIATTAGVQFPPAMTEAFREAMPPEAIAKCIAASIEFQPADSFAQGGFTGPSRHNARPWPNY